MSKEWQIPRRAFLRGLGTVIALPVFEAMLPPVRALAGMTGQGNEPDGFPKRLAFVYTPNGANMAQWSPEGVGTDYQLSPTLEPLAAHKADMTVISGLAARKAFGNGDGGGDHARASASYLTGCQAKKSASDIHVGISVDQVAANAVGDRTRFPSLELSCDLGQEAGSCDSGYSCAYQFNISWRSETQPMNPEIEPKAVFDRLFGGGSDGESREARLRREQQDKSVLDFVLDQTKTLESGLGTNDRRKLDEYLTAIREVEKQIARNGRMPPPVPAGAVGSLDAEYTFERHMRLMFDIMTLSFQTDSTRIATFPRVARRRQPPVPLRRSAGRPPLHFPPRRKSGKACGPGQDRPVARHPVRLFPRQAQVGQGGRRHPARQLHDRLRQGHQRPPGARSRQSADDRGRKRRRHDHAWAAHQGRGDPDHEPLRGDAGPDGCPHAPCLATAPGRSRPLPDSGPAAASPGPIDQCAAGAEAIAWTSVASFQRPDCLIAPLAS